ncbi:MAG: type VI secretion system membrane subunit TssM, partial [Thermoanaerobaculia bacterium]
MGRLLGVFARSANISFVALIVLGLLVWFGGEYFKFEPRHRFLAISVLLVLWLLLYVLQKVLALRASMLIEKRLRAQAQDQIQTLRPDRKPEVQALEKQLSEAIQSLKSSRLGKGALYALPWYVIIGPPASGKTTALLKSGLNFPYQNQAGEGVKIKGVGGTRNCDWWFTDQGILLDTAGRYTTEIEDRDEWLSFLGLLKRYRRRKPINGALVAVSVADLLQAKDEEVESHARRIRDRIDELSKQLELVFPVYLIFTKCDLLGGFVEFFEDFGKVERAQVWGCSFPYGEPSGRPYQAVFEEETRKLYGALCSQRLAGLASERPAAKKQAIYSFPLQFALARKRLAEFAAALFRPNPYQECAVFRGFYFTSGTQEGAPLDQVLEALRKAMGVVEPAEGRAEAVLEKKSYFIHELFTRIIFPDQGLARSLTRIEERRHLLRRAAMVGSVALSLLATVFLFISFFGNWNLASSAAEAARAMPPVERPGDPLTHLQALEKLRLQVESLDGYD